MPQQTILMNIWIVVVALFAIALAVLIMVLWEVRKTAKVISDVAGRIDMLTDIKGWVDFFRFFKHKKKD